MMSTTVSGTDLKSGFVTMSDLLGAHSAAKILEYFEIAGITFDEGDRYSFEQVERSLEIVFGEAARLIIEDLKMRLAVSQNKDLA